jgi:hypothetical protein
MGWSHESIVLVTNAKHRHTGHFHWRSKPLLVAEHVRTQTLRYHKHNQAEECSVIVVKRTDDEDSQQIRGK